MDYDSDSSDFHFPVDTGLPKLSSPLSAKVPESRDWALDELVRTLQEKPCTEAENLLSFKQYIPVTTDDEDDDEDYNYGPPKLNLPSTEEKDIMAQYSTQFISKELHDILKGGFTLVQNDIQTNHNQHNNSPFHHNAQYSAPGLSWFNEAINYGRHEIENLDTIQLPKRQNNFSPFDNRHGNNNNATTVASCSEHTTAVQPDIEKPLPPLPIAQKKGFRHKLRSKLVKPFNKSASTLSEKPKRSVLQSTKKFIRSLLPVSSP
jgi:hypothetical protein